MDQAASIRERNERTRELVADDLSALADKLNVKKQASDAKHNTIAKIKGTLGMKHEPGSKQHDHGAVGLLLENKLALLALAWGAKSLVGKVNEHRAAHDTHATVAAPQVDTAAETGNVDKVKGAVSDATDTVKAKAGSVLDKAESVKGNVADARTSVIDASEHMKERASSMAGSVTEHVGEARAAVVSATPTSIDELSYTVRNNMPAFGLAALAAGALIGAFIPRTKIEKEKISELQHAVVDNAKSTVQSTVEQAKGAVQAGVDTVREEFEGEAHDEPTPSTTTPNRITGSTSRNKPIGANSGGGSGL